MASTTHRSPVQILDENSPPRVIHFGEDFLLEKLPAGTRVIYPPAPIEPLPNVDAAIRTAIQNPEGCDPLFAQLSPGMKVTIAVDDISLPLPMMRTPDVRQRMLEIVLDLLADYGIDDIEIIIATSLHRRMTESEIRRMVGPDVFGDHFPDTLYNYDAEDREAIAVLGETEKGETVAISKRAADSDLVIYLNINLVPMDGGHKSVSVGLAPYRSVRCHHNPETIRKCDSYMDPDHSELHHSTQRMGRLINETLNLFHIEVVLNNDMYGPALGFLQKHEESFTTFDHMKMRGLRWTLDKLPRAAKRNVFHRVPAEYGVIGVTAGATEPCHKKTLDRCYEQYCVEVNGQSDIVITGIPYVSPYNVNSILNPLLVQVMALGYFFNMYRGKPLVKKDGVMIVCHPMPDEFDPDFHPSYIEFFHRLLPDTTDSFELQQKYEKEFAENPHYIQMYRRGHAYHGVHPFYMWYWGENGRAHVGKVIAVGAESPRVPRLMGWDTARNMTEAIAMAKDHLGNRSPHISMMHHPPILLTDVK